MSLLNKIYVIIRNTDIDVNFKHLMDSKDDRFHTEWARIITSLQDKQQWKEARVTSELLGYPTKDITLNQVLPLI